MMTRSMSSLNGNWRHWRLSFAVIFGVLIGHSSHVLADVKHVVARGHTIEAISHRYRVSAQAIMAANHLDKRGAKQLQPGEILIIPGVNPKVRKPSQTGSRALSKSGEDVQKAIDEAEKEAKAAKKKTMKAAEEKRLKDQRRATLDKMKAKAKAEKEKREREKRSQKE